MPEPRAALIPDLGRSQRHRVRWRAFTATQYHELIRQPHQRRAVRIHAREQVEHGVRIADALHEKVAFLLLEPSLCRHGEIPFHAIVEAVARPVGTLPRGPGDSRRPQGARKWRWNRPLQSVDVVPRRQEWRGRSLMLLGEPLALPDAVGSCSDAVVVFES